MALLVLSEKIQEHITLITLNRGEKRNALNNDLIDALSEAVMRAGDSRCMMFTGAGPCFCSGLDLKEAADPEKLSRLIGLIYASPSVTFGLAHGSAVAGGAAILAACDFAMATPDTKIGYPATRRGIIAAPVMRFLLAQLGDRATRELLLLGEMVDSEWAIQHGLLNAVASDVHLLPIAIMYAEKVLQGAPKATRMTKQILDEIYSRPCYKDLEICARYHKRVDMSDEAKEGRQAFVEKRDPCFTGLEDQIG